MGLFSMDYFISRGECSTLEFPDFLRSFEINFISFGTLHLLLYLDPLSVARWVNPHLI